MKYFNYSVKKTLDSNILFDYIKQRFQVYEHTQKLEVQKSVIQKAVRKYFKNKGVE